MKRALALTLALSFVAAGCTKQTAVGTPGGGASGGGGVTVGNTPPFVNTSTTQQNSFTKPHVLRLTDEEDVETLNPLLTSDTSVTLILAPLTMAYLVRWDKNSQPIPELVTQVPTQQNGGVSKDGLTITYHLRKGVKWSDGQPFDADDVIFSFKAVLNPNNNVTNRQGFDRITKMDEPDKYTVVLHLSKPYSPFVETFFSTAGANPALLPKHLLAQYPNLNNVPYNAKPVGIAPFMVKEWSRGSRVVLVQNPYYFRGLPKLKEIDFEIITNANTVLTELQAKSLDMFWYAPQNMVDQFAALGPFVTWAQPGYYFRHIDFNLRSPKLSDLAVREALRMAIDRPTILNKLYHNIGILQEQPAPKVSAYWDPNIQVVPFNVAKANQLLDQAGWKRGPDGIRAKNGVKLDLNFVTATGTVINDQLIELVRSTWSQLGVSLTVSHYLNTLLFAQYQDGGILYRGKYDLAYYAWGQDALGDFSSIYGCDAIPPAGQNSVFWCNKRADKAMHDFFGHYNQSDRNKDDAIVMEELVKDVPTIVVMGTATLWVYNRDVKNLSPGALSPFDNFMDVDI
ncbi:MAG TPA: peptide ABC transporter substrate-binding protein [Candidatus Baltobacteraceae bacterium]|jgi:peptide/nickel transport system substrate-binding protein|nr:peptide ABC transporter substrate-binding protein [Candidatus Baltobacteraceae bacterium]